MNILTGMLNSDTSTRESRPSERWNGEQRTFDLSKGTAVTMADMKDEKTKSAVSMDAMMGLAGIYSAASEALPDEVGAMVALFSLTSSSEPKK